MTAGLLSSKLIRPCWLQKKVFVNIYTPSWLSRPVFSPDTHLFELSDSRLFAIQRFHREDQRRIFSASAAGLLREHLAPSLLDYEQLIRLAYPLTRSNTPTREIFRRIISNLFSGNQDDHAKNWNFLQDDSGDWSLSPAFDITFSPNPYYEHSPFQGFWKSAV